MKLSCVCSSAFAFLALPLLLCAGLSASDADRITRMDQDEVPPNPLSSFNSTSMPPSAFYFQPQPMPPEYSYQYVYPSPTGFSMAIANLPLDTQSTTWGNQKQYNEDDPSGDEDDASGDEDKPNGDQDEKLDRIPAAKHKRGKSRPKIQVDVKFPSRIQVVADSPDGEAKVKWEIETPEPIDSKETRQLLDRLHAKDLMRKLDKDDKDLIELEKRNLVHPMVRVIAYATLTKGFDQRNKIFKHLRGLKQTLGQRRDFVSDLKSFNNLDRKLNANGVLLQQVMAKGISGQTLTAKIYKDIENCIELISERILAENEGAVKPQKKRKTKVKREQEDEDFTGESENKITKKSVKRKKKIEDDETPQDEAPSIEQDEPEENDLPAHKNKKKKIAQIKPERPLKIEVAKQGNENLVAWHIQTKEAINSEKTQKLLKELYRNKKLFTEKLSMEEQLILEESGITFVAHRVLAFLVQTIGYQKRQTVLTGLSKFPDLSLREQNFMNSLADFNGHHPQKNAFGILLQEVMANHKGYRKISEKFLQDLMQSIKYVNGLLDS